jgi:hypothetical protein
MPPPFHEIEGDGQVLPPRKRLGDQGGLVEPARPDPPTMQRHGRDDNVHRWSEPLKLARDRFGQAGTAAMLQADGDGSGDLAIGDGRLHAVQRRRGAQTFATARIGAGIDLEWIAARGAGRPAQEIQFHPAGRAEAMILGRHLAATGAARRQRERQYRGTQAPRSFAPVDHVALVR